MPSSIRGRSAAMLVVFASVLSTACAVGTHDPASDGLSPGGSQLDAGPGGDGGLYGVDGAPSPGTDGTPTIYGHTDDSLYAMDPTTKAVTLVGAFSGGSGSMTDCAVDGNGRLFVNSSSAVYSAALPAGGVGPVALTLKTSLPSGSKFYAL